MDIQHLKLEFAELFPEASTVKVCRAPGRVNLIGEHTDYNGLPVLPMALEQAIYVAYAPRTDGVVRLRNLDTAFPDVEFTNTAELPPSPAGAWENYCKAALQGLNDHLAPATLPGFDALVCSDLPTAAGLSSSSAMVVAFSLVYLDALGTPLETDMTRLELAELLAEAEQYVGTRGGGMDQAIILNGSRDRACQIDFFPLRFERAPLPEGYAIVVCDSLVKAEKSGAMLRKYNAGPKLCKLCCALVEKHLQEDFGDDLQLDRLGDLWYGMLCMTSNEVEALFDLVFKDDYLLPKEVAQQMGISLSGLNEHWLQEVPDYPQGLPLKARARHQRTEYLRVVAARDALIAGDATTFGALMNASHESCANDFAISCPELDRLTEIARDAGALGARLTGAGFGGATVNLVRVDQCDRFIEDVTEVYYRQERNWQGAPPLFIAQAGDGAGYIA